MFLIAASCLFNRFLIFLILIYSFFFSWQALQAAVVLVEQVVLWSEADSLGSSQVVSEDWGACHSVTRAVLTLGWLINSVTRHATFWLVGSMWATADKVSLDQRFSTFFILRVSPLSIYIQGYQTQLLKGHSPAEFISNPAPPRIPVVFK